MTRGKRQREPTTALDPRQLDLFPNLTRFPKPTTVTVRGRWGVEHVPLSELPDWLARHAERTTSGS